MGWLAQVDAGALAPIAVVLAAMGGLLKVVLDSQERREQRHEEEVAARDLRWMGALTEHREQTEKFLGNHMSHNTEAMESNTRALHALVDAFTLVLEAKDEEDVQ